MRSTGAFTLSLVACEDEDDTTVAARRRSPWRRRRRRPATAPATEFANPASRDSVVAFPAARIPTSDFANSVLMIMPVVFCLPAAAAVSVCSAMVSVTVQPVAVAAVHSLAFTAILISFSFANTSALVLVSSTLLTTIRSLVTVVGLPHRNDSIFFSSHFSSSPRRTVW